MAAILAVISLSSCHTPAPVQEVDVLQDADLVFVRGSESAMDAAICESTSDSSVAFTHVAIIERSVRNDELYVIESVPQHGVIRRPFAKFVEENGAENLVFKRLEDSVVEELAVQFGMEAELVLFNFVLNAKTHLGEDYDFSFMPDNEICYCSELVWESYISETLSPVDPHLFQARPMNFLAPDGTMPAFWTELFDNIGAKVPQGVMGTNPEDLSKEPILKTINPQI